MNSKNIILKFFETTFTKILQKTCHDKFKKNRKFLVKSWKKCCNFKKLDKLPANSREKLINWTFIVW